jgi:hypothetical protein
MSHLAKCVPLLKGAGLDSLANTIKPITLEEAKKDYEKLRAIPCGKGNPRSNIGNTAMDYYFFQHRLATKAKGGDSFPEFYRSRGYLKTPSAKRLYEYGINHGKKPAVAAYDVFRIYKGSINAFKPIIARELYCRFKPTSILDFSAGWGGRCLAAMSLDINYTGFDTNTNLRRAYAGMKRDFPTKAKVSINFRDSSKVDYSKYDYDFVFTSPPYYMKTAPTEKYQNMPTYTDRADFNNRFLFPVIKNTYNNMNAGTYCLNIPIDMYEDVKKVLGAADTKIPLHIQSRFSDRPPVYKEFIYCWKKTSKGQKAKIGK